ncbi:nucleotide-diphospho-sugar transferase [Schizothecium vesticola]|uniref:Nucleotide-diphospho-sugar transferase n=1 Tax=Schizothecium vesticola TaxID=314040 RepID=A0AA40K4D3_9PEZI|nr:nucleotide-diphospho-sugar transferase [Schizothecium vesticola]
MVLLLLFLRTLSHLAPPPLHSSYETSSIKRKLQALLTIAIYGAVLFGVELVFSAYLGHDKYLYLFAYLAAWRYTRFFIGLVAWFAYRPAKLSDKPRYTPNKDVTVILPTIDPTGVDFQECILTCAQNSPAAIFVITAGDELLRQTKAAVQPYMDRFPSVKFTISRTNVASKREQVALAIPMVKTPITVMLDDHVFWKPNFLAGLLAPLEDPSVGMVGTNKAVRRGENLSPWRRIWNMIGAVYLLRHNFEIRSTNALDGGVFVVSGRTCAIRTAIIQDPVYMAGYTNELFFFKRFGPLNADDDNYTTRFCVTRGWRIKVQYTPETEITTTVGVADPVATKFLGQCRRWVRTTWRSNSCSLFTDGSVWSQQPWCVYAVYFTSFTNFALFTDSALVYLIHQSSVSQWWWLVVLWIIFTKAVKVSAYFWQHPQDLWTFPCYLLFAYFHSLIKLWALLTFWDCTWSGRDFTKIDALARGDDDSTAPKIQSMNNLLDKLGNTQAGQASPALRELHTRLARLPAGLKGRGPISMPPLPVPRGGA